LKPSVSTAVPFWFAIVTSTTAPSTPGGVVQAISVLETVLRLRAATPPKKTWFGPGPSARKPVPVSVTSVPPSGRPNAGAITVSVGAAW
jgi:hypothetical protein